MSPTSGSCLQPSGFGPEELDVRGTDDETLDAVEQFLYPAVALRNDRDRDSGALPLVLVIDLGNRDPEAVPQPVDDGTDRRPLRLQRAALRNMEIEAHRGRVHAFILTAPRGPRLSGSSRRGAPRATAGEVTATCRGRTGRCWPRCRS